MKESLNFSLLKEKIDIENALFMLHISSDGENFFNLPLIKIYPVDVEKQQQQIGERRA